MKTLSKRTLILLALASSACLTASATIYDAGVSPADALSGLTFGTHLIGGAHTSVAGIGGGGLSAAGSLHNGARTYIWDKGAPAATDLADGIANRGDSRAVSRVRL